MPLNRQDVVIEKIAKSDNSCRRSVQQLVLSSSSPNFSASSVQLQETIISLDDMVLRCISKELRALMAYNDI